MAYKFTVTVDDTDIADKQLYIDKIKEFVELNFGTTTVEVASDRGDANSFNKIITHSEREYTTWFACEILKLWGFIFSEQQTQGA